MGHELVRISHCPACYALERKLLFDFDKIRVHECLMCTHRFLDPCLSLEAMSSVYESNESLLDMNSFHAGYYDYGDLSVPSKTKRDFEVAISLITKYIPDPASKKVLDVGYGNGFFLAVARKAGWSVDGIDTSRENVTIAKEKFGLNLQSGDFLRDVPNEAAYDVISFWDILEHLAEPGVMLRKASAVMRPGGLILAGLPDDESLLRYFAAFLYNCSGRRFRMGLKKVYFWEHVSYFNSRSLQALFKRHGMQCLHAFQTSTDLDKFALPVKDKIIANAILAMGKITRKQNRQIAIFKKTG